MLHGILERQNATKLFRTLACRCGLAMPVSMKFSMICAHSLWFVDALSRADADKYVSVIALRGTSHHSLMLRPGGRSEQALHGLTLACTLPHVATCQQRKDVAA